MCLTPRRLPHTQDGGDRPHPPATCDHRARSTRPRRPTIEGSLRAVGMAVAVAAVIVVGMAAATEQAAAAEVMAGLVAAPAASVDQVLTNLRAWLIGILAGLATVFLTLGGIRYVMAGGNPGEIEKAKSAFRGAGIGYALAILAPLVVSVLRGIVGG